MADKEQMKMAGKPCEGLFMTDPVEAYRHIRYTIFGIIIVFLKPAILQDGIQ